MSNLRWGFVVAVLAGAWSAVGSARAVGAAEVFCPEPLVAVFEGPDYSGSGQAKPAMRIVAAANGQFCGQAVVFSKEPIAGPTAQASDLRLKGGSATIPASAVQIAYAYPTGSEGGANARFPGIRTLKRFDALLPTPRDKATTHVVWATVNVPADAAAGAYEGTLTLGLDKPVAVAVTVDVAGFKMPDPIDTTTFLDLIQSPDSVAMQYGAAPWSDRHFELMAKSFRQLGRVGNKTCYIPLIAQTHFGNPETMVRWVADADGKGYSHDFTIAEKYLDLCIKEAGKPQVIVLYAWDLFTGGGYFGAKGRKPEPPAVSRLDPQSGQVELLAGPILGTPEAAAFFKPVFDGLHERIVARGIDEKAIMVGIAGDSRPSKEIVEMFHTIAPYARWVVHSHGAANSLFDTKVGYLAHVWGVGGMPDPDKGNRQGVKRFYGWKNEFLRTVFPRYGGGGFVLNPPLWANAPLATWRSAPEITLAANLRGIGRVGADFWGVLEGDRGRRATLINRYPHANWHQLSVTAATASVLHPGPDGAVPTIRFELIRQGLADAEAKVVIERLLDDKAARAKLGEDKAAKLQELLDDRVRYEIKGNTSPRKDATEEQKKVLGWEHYATQTGWQDRLAKLYAAAAEAAAAAGK